MVRYRWRTHLKSAESQQDVLDLVSRYLAEWKGEEIGLLPYGTWPPAINAVKELLSWTFRLGQEHARITNTGSREELRLLHELLLFFTHASVRATQLQSPAGSQAPSDAASAPSPRMSEGRQEVTGEEG